MRKLMLEALAAWLALAAVCGQARAATQQTDAASTAVSLSAVADRNATRTTTGVTAPAGSSLKVVDGPQSNAPGYSLPGADDISFDNKNSYGGQLKRRAAFNQRDAATALQRGVVPGNDGGQLKVIQTVRDEDSEAAKFNLIANAKPAPGNTTVPEPGSWATLLAGLLGVIAIARRRMSL